MEALVMYILGILFGFLAGILLTGLPYMYRKNKKFKQHGFRYRRLNEQDEKA